MSTITLYCNCGLILSLSNWESYNNMQVMSLSKQQLHSLTLCRLVNNRGNMSLAGKHW